MADQKTQYVVAAQDSGSSPPSSALLSPRTKVSRGWLQIRQNAHKFWLLEAGASILSLLMFASIVGVLLFFSDRVYGDATTMENGLSKRPILFPALAIMSAVMRATMLLPVATAIGQLKWTWFRSSRRLIDIERFDEAARGILGSAKLMFYLRFRNLAAIGAALTILALPLDAIIQSAVLIPSRVETVRSLRARSYGFDNYSTDTNFSRATTYTAYYQMTAPNDVWPDLDMINALQFGQSYSNGPVNVLGAPVLIYCPTGYCTFNKSQTLSVGRQCVQRTDIRHVPKIGNSAAYQTLPGTDIKFYYDGYKGVQKEWIVAATYDKFPTPQTSPSYPSDTYETDIFGAVQGPLITRTAMLFNAGPKSPTGVDFGTLAMECILMWTVNTHTIYVNDTTDFEYYADPDNSVTFTPKFVKSTHWEMIPSECIVDGKRVPDGNDPGYDEVFYSNNCVFVVGLDSHTGIQKMLMDPEYGLVGNMTLIEEDDDKNRVWNRRNAFMMNMDGMTYNHPMNYTYSRINQMWNNMAWTATATIRLGQSMQAGGNLTNLGFNGTISALVFYYSIDWPRLGMPAFIVLCCALFVLYTAFLTRKEYAWRRSALPLLFHGLEDQEQFAQGDVRDFNVMQDLAKDIRVCLTEHVDTNGARLRTVG